MYLRIANPGLADPSSLTILGISTSRGDSRYVGCFGTGQKYSIALLLRKNILPIIFVGNLKMEFTTERLDINDGSSHQLIVVHYSGKDIDGKTIKRKDKLSYTTGMGELDWTDTSMACREFVSNALDGAVCSNGNYTDVSVELTTSVRAKSGQTQVFIPATPEVVEFYNTIKHRFLHFHPNRALLKGSVLPKQHKKGLTVYKKGVMVFRDENRESIFDYNLNDELKLDESRNAEFWNCVSACTKAIADADEDTITTLIEELNKKQGEENLFESRLDTYYMEYNHIYDKNLKEKKASLWQRCFNKLYGENAVAIDTPLFGEYVTRKGYSSVQCHPLVFKVLRKLNLRTQEKVLSGAEQQGKNVNEATAEMRSSVAFWWNILTKHGMTMSRTSPPNVYGFTQVMEGEAQCYGYYDSKTEDVYLHNDLSGTLLNKVTLEEICHYVTKAGDCSRDVQDWAFRLATVLAAHELEPSAKKGDSHDNLRL